MKATPRGVDFETSAKSFNIGATKQAVIEFKNNAPSKVMAVSSGVTLVEKGKSVNGMDFSMPGKLKLDEYRKMHDPRAQQVDHTMKQRSSEMALRVNVDQEDPYRSFRRDLIKNQREPSAQNKKRNDTTRSRDSKNYSAFSLHSGS